MSMGSNQYWAGRVYDMCVYNMTGAPEGSPKVVLYGEVAQAKILYDYSPLVGHIGKH